MHLLAHPLPEARVCGTRMLEAVKAVIPSFVSRVERPGRGDVWVDYLGERRAAERRWAERLGPGPRRRGRGALVRPARARRRRRGPAARRAALRGRRRARGARRSQPSARSAPTSARGCSPTSSASARTAATARAAASRRCATASRSSPTTAPSATSSATACSPSSGSRSRRTSAPRSRRRSSPPAAATSTSARSTARRAEYERLRDAGLDDAAPYALCLGYRIRYVLDLNAREAMHLTELRSAREGHASYRAVAQAMHAAIAERPPGGRRDDEARRPLDRAPPRAHPGRDPRRVAPRVA